MMYLYAKSGSKHAINAGTIRMYSSIATVGSLIIDIFNNYYYMNSSLDDFIKRGRGFRVYQIEPDTGASAKKFMGVKLLNEMKNCEELKVHFTKSLLRN